MAGIVPLPEGVAHGAYIAAVAFSWGLLSVAIIGALTTLGRRTGRAVSLGDVAWALASLATLAAWIFAGYAWNVAKFGKVELDAVGPTTLWWPVTVIVATVFLFAARHVQRAVGTAAWAVVGVCVAILLVDITLSTVGAIRDGSVSELGLVVGGLALLQVAMFVGRIFAIRRSRSASTS